MKKKYAWASITKSCTNFGNYLIEYNLKNILKDNGFSRPTYIFDSFKNYEEKEAEAVANKINKLDYLIVPGCTTLSVGHYPGLKAVIDKINVPIYNLGAAFFGKPQKHSVNYLKFFFSPIGARDPTSSKFLTENNFKNSFIGCPTLFSGNAKDFSFNNSKEILFIMGLYKRET